MSLAVRVTCTISFGETLSLWGHTKLTSCQRINRVILTLKKPRALIARMNAMGRRILETFLVIPTNPHTSCFLFHISHIYFPRSDHHRSKTRDGMTKQSDGALPLSDLFSTSVLIFRNHARHKARALFIVFLSLSHSLTLGLGSSTTFPFEGWTNFKVKCS